MTSGRRVLLVDASVLINLLHVDLVSEIASIAKYVLTVPAEAAEEVTVPEQAAKLNSLAEAGAVTILPAISSTSCLSTFAELRAVMGRGEAACLALASEGDAVVACDERGVFRREATRRLGPGRLATTPGLMIMAIEGGHLTVERADEAKRILERCRFKMDFETFQGALGDERRSE